MRNRLPSAVLMLAAAMSLGGCLGPEHDPHFLPYQAVWPGNSSGVMQYSTNPYAAPNAPPVNPGPAGAGAFP